MQGEGRGGLVMNFFFFFFNTFMFCVIKYIIASFYKGTNGFQLSLSKVKVLRGKGFVCGGFCHFFFSFFFCFLFLPTHFYFYFFFNNFFCSFSFALRSLSICFLSFSRAVFISLIFFLIIVRSLLLFMPRAFIKHKQKRKKKN